MNAGKNQSSRKSAAAPTTGRDSGRVNATCIARPFNGSRSDRNAMTDRRKAQPGEREDEHAAEDDDEDLLSSTSPKSRKQR